MLNDGAPTNLQAAHYLLFVRPLLQRRLYCVFEVSSLHVSLLVWEPPDISDYSSEARGVVIENAHTRLTRTQYCWPQAGSHRLVRAVGALWYPSH